MHTDSSSIEYRLARIEAIENIRRLKHEYCYACDANYDVQRLKPLFAPEAIWQADGFGCYQGPDAIGEFFAGVSEQIIAAAHLVLNDVIDVSDDLQTAKGTWRNIQPVTVKDEVGEPQARWMLARYDETYCYLDGRWYFQQLDASIQFSTDYQEGWGSVWSSSL